MLSIRMAAVMKFIYVFGIKACVPTKYPSLNQIPQQSKICTAATAQILIGSPCTFYQNIVLT